MKCCGNKLKFQSPHTRGVRLCPHCGQEVHPMVSIPSYTRGATIWAHMMTNGKAGFNPLIHAGCDTKVKFLNQKERVSIPSYTRGATAGSFSPCGSRAQKAKSANRKNYLPNSFPLLYKIPENPGIPTGANPPEKLCSLDISTSQPIPP